MGPPLYMDWSKAGIRSCGPWYRRPSVIAEYCDAFYIGGTKVGGSLRRGRCVPEKGAGSEAFFTIIKQHGALLAKRRLLGIQFDTLFTDGLYMEVSRHAIRMAEILKQGLREKGYGFHIDSPRTSSL